MDLPLNFTGEFKLKFNSNFTIPIKNDEKIGLEDTPRLEDQPLIDFNNQYVITPILPIEDIPTPFPIEKQVIPPLPLPEDQRTKHKRKVPCFYTPPIVDEFPVELKTLLQPLICLLCNVQSNSWVSAKQHYDSKNHDKKIKVWLDEWAKKTGECVPFKKQKIVTERPNLPNIFHCGICDIHLTSLQHADQHYRGRKHQMVMYKQTQQFGFGYYPGPDPTNRFGIGHPFLRPEIKPDNPEMKNKYCEVCGIYVSSESQLQTHFEGSKHSKKLKSLGAPPHSKPDDTILTSLEKSTATTSTILKRDISIFRTPSGKYYCQACDITLSTEILFTQHLDCKKHRQNN